ncbi:TrbC/VirB2 family protein [Ehrlichia sp. JZT12]
MLRTILKFFPIVVFVVGIIFTFSSNATEDVKQTSAAAEPVEKVICNVIKFVQNLGLPIMTGVILGSSIMAIFGKLPWPAIVMLVVFTAIFFGAGKLITKFVDGINSEITEGQNCT